MISTKYIGMDVHKESISIAVRNAAGKVVMECVIETKALGDIIYDNRRDWWKHINFQYFGRRRAFGCTSNTLRWVQWRRSSPSNRCPLSRDR